MVNARSWLALVLISFGTVAATVSCGSDEVTGGGGLITGGAGGAGGSAGSAGKGGAVGRSGSGGTSSADTSVLGSPCTADLDCGGDFKCVTPDDATLPTSGGPANGLCTIACKNNSECDTVLTGAGCVNFGEAAYCLEPCQQVDPGTDITAKCHGRLDEACAGYSSGAVLLCRPTCAADADCGGSLFCNTTTGRCSKTKPTGAAPGSPCTPGVTTPQCLGTCLDVTAPGATNKVGVCTQLCATGLECQFTGTQPSGLCAGPLTANPSVLDLGFCEPACNCTGDCTVPGDVCQAWTSDASMLQADIGSAGFCYPNALGSVELTCSEGGAGGNTPPPPGSGAAGASGAPN